MPNAANEKPRVCISGKTTSQGSDGLFSSQCSHSILTSPTTELFRDISFEIASHPLHRMNTQGAARLSNIRPFYVVSQIEERAARILVWSFGENHKVARMELRIVDCIRNSVWITEHMSLLPF
jgi:hypothetical protein